MNTFRIVIDGFTNETNAKANAVELRSTFPDREVTVGKVAVADGLTCDVCNEIHDKLRIASRCHPGAPVWADYHADGTVEIFCSECDNHIVTLNTAGIPGR